MNKIVALFVAALASVSMSYSSLAQEKAKLSPKVVAKTQTAGAIAGALAKSGVARVIVTVGVRQLTPAQLQASVHAPASRAAAKALIASAIEEVISAHALSAKKNAAVGAPAITRLTTAPAFGVTVDAAELDDLVGDPRVKSVEYDRQFQKNLAVTLPTIGMPSVRAAGGTGANYGVAVIDDGVQRTHPFIGLGRIAGTGEACFLDTNNCPNGTNAQTGVGAAEAAAGASHGTHVAGIALGRLAGSTPSEGVSPGSWLVPINIFGPNATVSFSTIQRAFEYVEDIVLLNSATNPYRIYAINMSVGGGSSAGNCDGDPDMVLLKPVIDGLRAQGVLAAVSAGNDYFTGSMGFPACLSSIVSVASTNRAGTAIASYSNISPTTDIFAPGGELGTDCVVSSVPTSTFGSKCGTSMASPHVAGAIAVLKQLAPTASACRLEDAIKSTGPLLADTRSGGTISKPSLRADLALTRLQSPSPPANDNFAAATIIPANAALYANASSTIGATLEAGEPHSTRSIWWRWTPTTTGTVTIDTLGSGIDTVLAVYAGASSASSLGSLVAFNNDISATEKASRVTFQAVAGQVYSIIVAGVSLAEQCNVQLNMTRPPANDNFASAMQLTVYPTLEYGIGGSNVAATKEPGEPNHNGDATHTSTVWFKFTAPVTGAITLDTEGSPLSDTVLAVYTGSAVSALTQIAVDDDSGTGFWSRLTFNMVAGTEYKIALMGYGGLQGRYRLWFAPAGALSVNHAKGQLVQLAE